MIRAFLRRLWPNPRVILAFVVVLPFIAIGAFPAQAKDLPPVRIVVDIPTQTMNVFVGGEHKYGPWPVSTASDRATGCTVDSIPGGEPIKCETPVGEFSINRIQPMAYAGKWENSPMYTPVFFGRPRDGIAIHGTDEVAELGRPASHGCVRLDPANAKLVYGLAEEHQRGRSFPSMTIVVNGPKHQPGLMVRT